MVYALLCFITFCFSIAHSNTSKVLLCFITFCFSFVHSDSTSLSVLKICSNFSSYFLTQNHAIFCMSHSSKLFTFCNHYTKLRQITQPGLAFQK